MSESDSTEPSVGETVTDEITKSERKRVRHRKKQLYERILRQMEFYFSDANLTKDRFLAELTRTDPAVPLEVFLKFNKIRALTHNVNDIVKALANSTLLVCSDDKTKVRRVTELRPYDAEQRTIYVESVPAKASREWLEEVFREYGAVAYISLPKFKSSQKIKGFAFIEFEKPEDAQKCLAAFTKMGCKLPTCMPPEELTTIKVFSSDRPDESTDKSTPNTPTEESKSLVESLNQEKMDQGNLSTEITNRDNQEERKRQAETDDGPPKKKQKKNKKSRKSEEGCNVKQASEEDTSNKTVPSKQEPEKSSNTKSKEPKESEASSQDEATKPEQKSKNKCRKRTSKERSKSKHNVDKNEAPKAALWGLQVLSKMEWRVLRNKYLNLQWKTMKEVKNNLRMKGFHQEPANTQPVRRNVNEGAAGGGLPGAGEGARGAEKVEGVFVRVELPEPCLDVRLTKRQVRSNVHVQHVDVKEGQTEMFVRFDTPDAATQYCSSGIYSGARVLLGEESTEQWRRATTARSTGGAGRRERGRTRLLQRAAAAAEHQQVKCDSTATHIRFEEREEIH